MASIAAYGDTGPIHEYEYDHLVSLELGGATNDPRNLWPEPGASPNPKDAVEDTLHSKVCDGAMTLREAQHIIATQWVSSAGAVLQEAADAAPPESQLGEFLHQRSCCGDAERYVLGEEALVG